jgi:hypothetical protein
MELIEEIAERCVPRIEDPTIKEVYCLLKVSDKKYYVIKAQHKSVTQLISKHNKQYNINMQCISQWTCSPNAILLHHAVRKHINYITVSRSTIILHGEHTEEELVQAINEIHRDRF